MKNSALSALTLGVVMVFSSSAWSVGGIANVVKVAPLGITAPLEGQIVSKHKDPRPTHGDPHALGPKQDDPSGLRVRPGDPQALGPKQDDPHGLRVRPGDPQAFGTSANSPPAFSPNVVDWRAMEPKHE